MQILQANKESDLPAVEQLLREYLIWTTQHFSVLHHDTVLTDDMLRHSMDELELYFPPTGALLLAVDEKPVAIGFLKRIRQDACEIKRMYVRSEARGLGLGKKMLQALIDQAVKAGYRQVMLDSGKFMHQAHALYRSAGFAEIEKYPESEMAGELDRHLVYMRLELNK